MKKKPAHVFIVSLIYPAFLGAFIFEAMERYEDLGSGQRILVTVLLIHYIADFLYTAHDKQEQIYGTRRMLLDLVLVILLYRVMTHVLTLPTPSANTGVWGLLALFKLLAFAWEWAGWHDRDHELGSIVDAFFLLLYGVGWFFFPTFLPALVAIVLVDGLTYFWWPLVCDYVSRRKQGPQTGGARVSGDVPGDAPVTVM